MQENMIFLISLSDFDRLDLLVWIVGIPLLIFFSVYYILQLRQNRKLKADWVMLTANPTHSIEYDLVLKAMKLCVWHFDVLTGMVTFDGDYRDGDNNLQIGQGGAVDGVIGQMLPEYREKAHQLVSDLIAGLVDEIHLQYELQVPHTSQIYWAESYATIERRDVDGQPLTIVGTSKRIDKQKKVEQELIEARNKAEESDRLKTAFLANMSHEVRTPLNAIVGFSDLLPVVQSEEERNQLITLIKENNRHLLRLFENMVSLSKLEAGGESSEKTRFALNDLLTEIVDKYAPESAKTGVRLKVEAMADSPFPFTDRERLHEILNQYVNNAMKFTSQGSVTLGYDVQGNQLRIWVKDTGKGIPADHCNDRLFERFVKIDDFVPGTGVGLSICRSLALSLGATVGVESTEGVGSCFWVELPLG